MKFKPTVLLVAVLVSLGLLLGTSTAQAATVIKVAAEGDTLPDDTILMDILLNGGVAINLYGQVAFGGRDADGTDAVFTQAGKVVEEGETLPDDTILAKLRGRGQVAISAGQSGDTVTFHGDGEAEEGDYDTDAVFTQDGVVAAVGDTLAEGTLDQINDRGKVAINYWNEVAFHGSVEIESEFENSESDHFRAVFISDGLDTLVVAREDTDLPDETPLKYITESGGVAISDMGEVAFHGRTADPASGRLPDKAVFTSNGLIAKESDNLPDGTNLDNINTYGGVAINLFGDVVFQGRTGGDEAVFTQNGLVAKVGDILEDGTTLSEISDIAGVAINPYGREVAFLGKAGPNAVFVGQAPLPPAP